MVFAVSGMCSSPENMKHGSVFFPIFHVSSVSRRYTLTPASLTTGIVERGVNFFFLPKYGISTDWKGLDQALLRGKMTQSMAGLITRKL